MVKIALRLVLAASTFFWLVFFCSAQSIGSSRLSPDGSFAAAYMSKTNEGTDWKLVVQSTVNSNKKTFDLGGSTSQLRQLYFTPDSQALLFQEKDTLQLYYLFKDSLVKFPEIRFVKDLRMETTSLLLCQSVKSNTALVLLDLKTNQLNKIDNVDRYYLSSDRNALILDKRKGTERTLEFIDTQSKNIRSVAFDVNSIISEYAFNRSNTMFVFVANLAGKKSIMSFDLIENRLVRIVNDSVPILGGISNIGRVASTFSFSKDDRKLLFYITEQSVSDSNAQIAYPGIEIWSYTDIRVKNQMLKDTNAVIRNLATYDFCNNRFNKLENESIRVLGLAFGRPLQKLEISPPAVYANKGFANIGSKYTLLAQFPYPIYSSRIPTGYALSEYGWNRKTLCNILLLNNNTGDTTLVDSNVKLIGDDFPPYVLSSNEDFIIYYDNSAKSYFSINICTSERRNITSSIKTMWAGGNEQNMSRIYNFPPLPNIVQPWVSADSSIFIQDGYSDIWMINLHKLKKPVCITNRFGYKQKIQLSFDYSIHKIGDTLFIKGFNLKSENSCGIYRFLITNIGSDPKMLISENGNFDVFNFQKAQHSEVFLFEKHYVSLPPRLFYKKQLPKVLEIESDQPEKRLWVKKKIVKWKTFDGSINQGLLVFPRNFDYTKKYPVIIRYYENQVLNWSFEIDKREDSWYDNYILFNPDINFRLGHTSRSAYNSVVSGAAAISKLPYIDSSRLGIYGHSFAGYETNCIITQTNKFAAAITSNGWSDFVSLFGTEDIDSQGYPYQSEGQQVRLGANLWERPDLVIKNSPVFYADRVSTPLLICHNRDDDRVPFSQGLEMFKSLRRLGKKVWLIAPEKGRHSQNSYPEQLVRQFWDHYLRGFPAPVWMTKGTSASKNVLKSEVEYDLVVKTPGAGLLMDNKAALDPRQEELLKHKTIINIEGRIVENNPGAPAISKSKVKNIKRKSSIG